MKKEFSTKSYEDKLFLRHVFLIMGICLFGIGFLSLVIKLFKSQSVELGDIKYQLTVLAFTVFIIVGFIINYKRLKEIKGSYVVFDTDSLVFKSRQVEKKFRITEIKAIIIKNNTIDIYDLNKNKFTIYLDDYNYTQFQFIEGKDKKEIKAIFLRLKTNLHTDAFSFAGQSNNNYIKSEQQAANQKAKKGFWAGSKSWALAVLTLFLAFIPLGLFMDQYPQRRELDTYVIVTLIIYFLIITVSCFLTVKHNPKSIWYVPFICNILTIIIAIGTLKYSWAAGLIRLLVGGFILSIIASIFGVLFGKMTVVPDNHQNTTE